MKIADIIEESWSKSYKKSINCAHPKGFSQRAHCAGRKARRAGRKTKSKSVTEGDVKNDTPDWNKISKPTIGTRISGTIDKVKGNLQRRRYEKLAKKYYNMALDALDQDHGTSFMDQDTEDKFTKYMDFKRYFDMMSGKEKPHANFLAIVRREYPELEQYVNEQGVAEGGAETSWSDDTDKITLQDILELTKHIKQIDLPINDNLKSKLLHWDGNPEEIERINQVTVSNQFPILVMIDEQGQIQWILDGNHRLQKAIRGQAKTIPAKLIKPSDLNDKARKIFNIKEQGVAEGESEYKLTDLDPWTFDQTKEGHRGLPTLEKQADAIKTYIDTYVKNGEFVGAPEGTKVIEPYMLYWHLGQALALMGRKEAAMQVMRQAAVADPDWNAYVEATISFLRQNRKDFDRWASLVSGNKDTIERLTAGWGQPYKQVYESRKGKSDACGDCFIVAGRAVISPKIPGLRLVHAFVTGQGEAEGKRFPHAWTEVGDVVLDQSNGRNIVMRREQYYEQGEVDKSPGQYAEYNDVEAKKKMIQSGNFGPWDLDEESLDENFADGKKPGRKGLAKRSGVNCKQSVGKLRKIAKNSIGERQRMAHWCANMKSGREK